MLKGALSATQHFFLYKMRYYFINVYDFMQQQ